MSKKTQPDDVVDQTTVTSGQVVVDPAHQAITTDENAGKGGNYEFDPVSGKRTKVED